MWPTKFGPARLPDIRTFDVEGEAVQEDLPALRAPVDRQREAGAARLQAAEAGRDGARGIRACGRHRSSSGGPD